MNFSRKGITAKQKNIKSSSKRLTSKLGVSAFRIAIVLIISVSIIGGMAGYGALNAIIDTAPDIDLVNIEPDEFASYIYYSDGSISQTLFSSEANRDHASIEEIPKMVQNCFIALEDERFYEHDGIDIRGIFRAGFSVLKSDGLGFGASTLTQQLLKNFVFGGGNEKNNFDKIVRKVQEQYLAIKIENILEKDQILEYYLNYVNMGSGAYGLKTAARTYFNKQIDELTLSEAATLAPIPLSPTNRNPITYPEKNALRRESCLNNMKANGYCTQEEYDEALNDNVYERIQVIAANKKTDKKTHYSYYTDALLNQVSIDLQEKLGYTPDQAKDLIYKGGIRIKTTQDKELQTIVDKYYNDESNFPDFGFGSGSCYELSPDFAVSVAKPNGEENHYHIKDFLEFYQDYVDSEYNYYHKEGGNRGISELFLSIDDMNAKIDAFIASISTEEDNVTEGLSNRVYLPQPQSSFVMMEQATGNVTAIYGGRGEKSGSLTLNRATGTQRQMGSAFKVLASFLPALDSGGLTLASVFDDSRYSYPGGKEVINHYSGFRGLQTIRRGISSSLNIVAVKTLEYIGPAMGYEYLEKLHFSTLVKSNDKGQSDINLAIALGGLTNGVSNLETTAAYAAIANNGLYTKPKFYTEILDQDGNVLLENVAETSQVIKPTTAWLLTSAMLDTVTRGTGTRLAFQNYPMSVAGKTGTSAKAKDLWFCGYTPYYTASIWTGYDNNTTQNNTTYQQNIWRGIMEEAHILKNLPNVTYEVPDSITTATICTKCGNLAYTGLCDVAAGGPYTKTEYFAKGTVPSSKCTCHVRATICKTSGQTSGNYCPPDTKVNSVFLLKDEDPTCTTEDTPYLMRSSVCNVHTSEIYFPPEIEDVPNIPDGDNTPDTVIPTKKPTKSPTNSAKPTKEPENIPTENNIPTPPPTSEAPVPTPENP